MARVIGIDLGTTNTCAAYVSNKFPRIVPTEGGFSTLPSIVSLQHSGTVLVGQAAKEQLVGAPDRTIGFVKRLLGRQYQSKVVRELQQRLSYTIVPGEGGEAAVSVGGKTYSPTVLQSHILRQLKRYAEIHLGEVIPDAVIAVPAFFSDHQRNLVKQAGKLAGFNVRRVVNEPTAAALAYGFNRGLDQRILIFDLGGGTFDVSVLELNNNVFSVTATGGDNYLGGADFDARVLEWILDGAKKQLKVDLSVDPKAMEQLRTAAERAKIELSLLANTQIRVATQDRKGKALNLELLLDRNTLNDLTRDLVQRSLAVTDRTLASKKLTNQDIHEIILVGGQTRMPLLIDMLTQHFGKGPRKGVHPDECVAMGAALLGDSLSRLDAVTLLDTLSVPLGVAKDGELQIVMERNVSLPAQAHCTVNARADRGGTVSIDIYQGDKGPVTECEYLGTLTHGPLPGAAGADVQVSVDFAMDAEGMLSITAQSNRSTEKQTVALKTIERQNPSPGPTVPGDTHIAGIIEQNPSNSEDDDGSSPPPGGEQPGIKGLMRNWLKR